MAALVNSGHWGCGTQPHELATILLERGEWLLSATLPPEPEYLDFERHGRAIALVLLA